MKNKLIIFLIVLLIAFMIYITINKILINQSSDNNKVEPIGPYTYECKKTDEWQEFNPSTVMGMYLGKYKTEYVIKFKINENNEILDEQSIQTIYYENGYGYSYYSGDYEVDDDNLIKTLRLNSIIIDYEKGDANSLLNKLNENNYDCSKE